MCKGMWTVILYCMQCLLEIHVQHEHNSKAIQNTHNVSRDIPTKDREGPDKCINSVTIPWQQTPGSFVPMTTNTWQLCSQAYPASHFSVCVDNNKRKQKSSAKWEGLGIFITWWMQDWHGAGDVASSGGPVELHHPLDYSRLETLENIPLDQSWTAPSLCQMNVLIFPALRFPCINA